MYTFFLLAHDVGNVTFLFAIIMFDSFFYYKFVLQIKSATKQNIVTHVHTLHQFVSRIVCYVMRALFEQIMDQINWQSCFISVVSLHCAK